MKNFKCEINKRKISHVKYFIRRMQSMDLCFKYKKYHLRSFLHVQYLHSNQVLKKNNVKRTIFIYIHFLVFIFIFDSILQSIPCQKKKKNSKILNKNKNNFLKFNLNKL